MVLALKTLDQSSLDQHAIEAAGLGAIGTAIEQLHAAHENFFLLGKSGIERHAGCFLNHQRQIGAFQGGERRAHIHRRKDYSVYRIISGEIAYIIAHDPFDYYAIDAINFAPVDVSSALDTLEGPYLPLVIQEAAGVPWGAARIIETPG